MGNEECKDVFKDIRSLKDVSDEYFNPGRKVRVIPNENYIKYVQSKCNGWDDSMLKCLNNVYEVICIDPDKGIILNCSKKLKWIFHRAALEPIEEDLNIYKNYIINQKNVKEPYVTKSCDKENGKSFWRFWKSYSNPSFQYYDKPESFPYNIGDEVTLSNDEVQFEKLQLHVGGYSKRKMRLILGENVIIKYIGPKFIKVDWKDEDFDIHPDLIIREHIKDEVKMNKDISKSKDSFIDSLDYSEIENNSSYERKLRNLFEYIEIGDLWNISTIIDNRLLNIKGYKGMTPINYASSFKNLEIVKELFYFGADTNIEDDSGMVPIHTAVKFNCEEILKYFLNNDPDSIKKLTSDGKSLLHIAVIENHKNLIEILQDAGVNIYIFDQDGKTAFQYANDSNDREGEDFNEPREEIVIKELGDINQKIVPEVINQFQRPPSPICIQNECEICRFRIKDTTFLNCGHTSCSECADQIVVCHMCKAKIIKRFKVYI